MSKDKDLARLNILIPQEMRKWLEKLVKEDYNSISEVVRDILRKYKRGDLIEKSKMYDDMYNKLKHLLNGKTK